MFIVSKSYICNCSRSNWNTAPKNPTQ